MPSSAFACPPSQAHMAGALLLPSCTGQPSLRHQAPASHKLRRGCMHCVSCSAAGRHRHSLTDRKEDVDQQLDWWPNGFHSPGLYFAWRAHQLAIALAYSPHPEVWRPLSNAPALSALLSRRRQPPLRVHLPNAYTNVPAHEPTPVFVRARALLLRPAPFARPVPALALSSLQASLHCLPKSAPEPPLPSASSGGHPATPLDASSCASSQSHLSACAAPDLAPASVLLLRPDAAPSSFSSSLSSSLSSACSAACSAVCTPPAPPCPPARQLRSAPPPRLPRRVSRGRTGPGSALGASTLVCGASAGQPSIPPLAQGAAWLGQLFPAPPAPADAPRLTGTGRGRSEAGAEPSAEPGTRAGLAAGEHSKRSRVGWAALPHASLFGGSAPRQAQDPAPAAISAAPSPPRGQGVARRESGRGCPAPAWPAPPLPVPVQHALSAEHVAAFDRFCGVGGLPAPGPGQGQEQPAVHWSAAHWVERRGSCTIEAHVPVAQESAATCYARQLRIKRELAVQCCAADAAGAQGKARVAGRPWTSFWTLAEHLTGRTG